ncbi:MAG: methyltransferase domain-containing protein [Candidatus Eremiobacteraeota bacterium]|nr:methyltransferase domain-containing protein [Candidatus Eremiobacteraeota bacterium]
MAIRTKTGLEEVKAVYGGPEGVLWKLIMGEQIHLGGFQSSMDLAERAGIQSGMRGIDLCCCNGAGMRFLVRFRGVSTMLGVDATPQMVELGKRLCEEEGMSEKITFHLSDCTSSGLPGQMADFIWGEDAWCYVVDKAKLISEAARMVEPGGIIAFTDWVEGKPGLTDKEAERYFAFMKFPNVESLEGYGKLLEKSGCEVVTALDTGRFAPCVDLYIQMLSRQLTYDALKIISFNKGMMEFLAGEMAFMKTLTDSGKIAQGLIVARKK